MRVSVYVRSSYTFFPFLPLFVCILDFRFYYLTSWRKRPIRAYNVCVCVRRNWNAEHLILSSCQRFHRVFVI